VRTGRYRRPLDPIETGAGHLHQLQSAAGRGHLRRERHGHQDVDISEPRDDAALVVDDDVARHVQVRPHRRLEASGESSREGDAKRRGRTP
jgi:hypothetical protein